MAPWPKYNGYIAALFPFRTLPNHHECYVRVFQLIGTLNLFFASLLESLDIILLFLKKTGKSGYLKWRKKISGKPAKNLSTKN